MSVTVVSSYYPIRSKFPAERYLQWIFDFWPKLSCPLIFFIDPQLEPAFREAFAARPGPTLLLPLPFRDLKAFQTLHPAVWMITHQVDPEKGIHSPELYALWYEKKEFVQRAIDLNPFQSEFFVWCDAGICRYPNWIPHLANTFPKVGRIPRGKLLLLQLNPFQEGDTGNTQFGTRETVGGGILAADRDGWKAWSAAYDRQLLQMYLTGRFIGKDQNIMAACCCESPELVSYVPAPPSGGPINRWFWLLFYLAEIVPAL